MNKRSQHIPPSNLLKGDQLSLIGQKDSYFDWEIDSGPTCNHLWQKSLNRFGCPQWKCFSCSETKPSDPNEDRKWWEASILQVQLQADEYQKRSIESRTKADRDKYLKCMTDCRVRHARMLSILNNPSDRVGYEQELDENTSKTVNPLANKELPGDSINGYISNDDSTSSVKPLLVPGEKETSTEGTLTQITPSNKPRRKKGEGTGSIFTTKVTRRSKSYTQHWFQYEESLPNNQRKRKSVYIPVNKVARIKQLQLDREPVDEILKALGHKKD